MATAGGYAPPSEDGATPTVGDVDVEVATSTGEVQQVERTPFLNQEASDSDAATIVASVVPAQEDWHDSNAVLCEEYRLIAVGNKVLNTASVESLLYINTALLAVVQVLFQYLIWQASGADVGDRDLALATASIQAASTCVTLPILPSLKRAQATLCDLGMGDPKRGWISKSNKGFLNFVAMLVTVWRVLMTALVVSTSAPILLTGSPALNTTAPCWAVFNMTGYEYIDPTTRDTRQTCWFATTPFAIENCSFIPGATHDHAVEVGEASNAHDCVARVLREQPTANGATHSLSEAALTFTAETLTDAEKMFQLRLVDWLKTATFLINSAMLDNLYWCWLLTLLVASVLGGDAVTEVINAVKSIDPPKKRDESNELRDDWARQVEEKVTGHGGLIETMDTLSTRWGGALVASLAAIFLNYFTYVLNSLHVEGWDTLTVCIVDGFFSGLCALLLLWPLATTSTLCDDLLIALNHKRLKHLEAHERIFALETGLRQLNNDQGLGFVMMFDTVVDKRKLKQATAALASVLPAVMTAVFALDPKTVADNVGTCGLTAEQRTAIENALESMASAYNESSTCSYNFTVA